METMNKIIQELKNDIKEAAEKQKFYRNQRKTERLIGERKIQPWEATMKHRLNREELRKMYAAYHILRGRDLSKIDSLKFDEEWQKTSFLNDVNTIIKLYKGEE